MTARTIITRALRLIKVIAANESGDAADLATGMTALNDMLGSWSLERNAVLATVIETFNATGALSYTIGPGGDLSTPVPISVPIVEYTVNGLDYSLTEWTEQQYASIGQKSEIGQPVGYWFVKSPTLAKLYFAPAPSTGSFKIHSVKAITAFSGLDTSYDLAPGYQDALVYCLAVNLAGEFEAEAPKTVILKAMNLKRTLKRSNAVIPVLDAGVPLNPYRYGYYE